MGGRDLKSSHRKQNPGPRRNKEHTHGEARLLCKHSDLSLISLPDKRRREGMFQGLCPDPKRPAHAESLPVGCREGDVEEKEKPE